MDLRRSVGNYPYRVDPEDPPDGVVFGPPKGVDLGVPGDPQILCGSDLGDPLDLVDLRTPRSDPIWTPKRGRFGGTPDPEDPRSVGSGVPRDPQILGSSGYG